MMLYVLVCVQSPRRKSCCGTKVCEWFSPKLWVFQYSSTAIEHVIRSITGPNAKKKTYVFAVASMFVHDVMIRLSAGIISSKTAILEPIVIVDSAPISLSYLDLRKITWCCRGRPSDLPYRYPRRFSLVSNNFSMQLTFAFVDLWSPVGSKKVRNIAFDMICIGKDETEPVR